MPASASVGIGSGTTPPPSPQPSISERSAPPGGIEAALLGSARAMLAGSIASAAAAPQAASGCQPQLDQLAAIVSRSETLATTTMPAPEDVRDVAAILCDTGSAPSVLVSACETLICLCRRGDSQTNVETRLAFGRAGCVPYLVALVTASAAHGAVVLASLSALAQLCGDLTFDTRAEDNIAAVLVEDGTLLLKRLVEVSVSPKPCSSSRVICVRLS